MFRLSVHPERPTTSSTPSLDLAWQTLEPCSHWLCWADGGEDVLTHSGCLFEIHSTNSATPTVTIESLWKSFTTLGLLEVVVSDNATAFTSPEFTEFLKRNRIRHVQTPPYHPASNGLIERAVQTFKESFKRLREGSINTRISRFLFKYRLTPHSSTGVYPAEQPSTPPTNFTFYKRSGAQLATDLDSGPPEPAIRA